MIEPTETDPQDGQPQMSVKVFEVLGLSVGPIDSEHLSQAYQHERKIWFLRQFDPKYVVEARSRLESIDEAYRVLRDPRRRAAVVREARAEARGVRREPPILEQAPPSETSALPSRPQIVQQLLIDAERIMGMEHRPLDESEIDELASTAFEMGLPFDESRELAARVARRVQLSSGQKKQKASF